MKTRKHFLTIVSMIRTSPGAAGDEDLQHDERLSLSIEHEPHLRVRALMKTPRWHVSRIRHVRSVQVRHQETPPGSIPQRAAGGGRSDGRPAIALDRVAGVPERSRSRERAWERGAPWMRSFHDERPKRIFRLPGRCCRSTIVLAPGSGARQDKIPEAIVPWIHEGSGIHAGSSPVGVPEHRRNG